MSETIIAYPLLFGIVASLAHVLAGPDHLAAIGPLAVNAKKRPWLIGVAWGIGHLAGMLLIGVLFFYLKDFIPVEFISENSERLVGILLIAIGIWAIYKMFSFNNHEHTHDHTHDDESGHSYVHRHQHQHEDQSVHSHTHENKDKQSYIAALGIGILHGLAGVSHFLGLLPTLAFESSVDSILYISGFAIGTILAMVIFSSILGFIAEKASQSNKDLLFKAINGITGLSAIVVGIIWIWSTW